MNQNKLSFESEKLVIDYISFNIQGLVDRKQVERIAKYFFQILGFNSTFAKGPNGSEEDLFLDFQNQHQVSFRYYLYASEYITYWSGTKVDFSGKNATQFYTIIKQQKFDWNIFDLSSTSLGRFDYYYFRPITDAHNDDKLKYFMQSSCDKILTNYKRRKATFGREETGYVTRIGSRTSSNYYRIYQTEQGVKFELELKNPLLKSFQSFLFNNQIEIFERKLALHFYKLSINQIQLNSCYTDWLVSWTRQIVKKPEQNILETTYLENHRFLSFDERELIYNLFRVLVFLRSYQGKRQTIRINGDLYSTISFPLADLVDHLYMDKKNKRHTKKVSKMLQDFMILQPIVQTFSDIHFRALVLFPNIKVLPKGRISIVSMTLAEQLFYYNFPCYLTNSFNQWDNKYQFYVQFEILRMMSTPSLQKELHVQEFLGQFNLSNKKQTEIKRLIIQSLQELIDKRILNSIFKTTQKDGSIRIQNNLTSRLVTKSKIIYLEEILHYKYSINHLIHQLES
jgi:hypothetical protein